VAASTLGRLRTWLLSAAQRTAVRPISRLLWVDLVVAERAAQVAAWFRMVARLLGRKLDRMFL
jgi:hypothetical protein